MVDDERNRTRRQTCTAREEKRAFSARERRFARTGRQKTDGEGSRRVSTVGPDMRHPPRRRLPLRATTCRGGQALDRIFWVGLRSMIAQSVAADGGIPSTWATVSTTRGYEAGRLSTRDSPLQQPSSGQSP